MLDRFRPYRETGSAPFHYTLGVLGAAFRAADRDEAPTLRRPRVIEAWQRSPRLAHLLGINSFFTDLLGQERRGNGELIEWWSEARCAREMAGLVYPDGFGEWREGDKGVEFYLEVDRSTEDGSRLRAKLDGYMRLKHSTGIDRPVLFWLPSARREQSVRAALSGASIAIATAVVSDQPWEPIWRPLGEQLPRRLVDL